MSDAKQESEKFTSHSKLSATVPAFVPGEAYTGSTFPSNLVIDSNLSPLVPEFKPSVSFTSYAPPYKPGHHFQYSYHQSYIKQGNIEVQQNVPFQVYQTSYSQSRKSTAKKTAGKTITTKKIEQNKEGQNTAENNGGENLTDTDSTVNAKKKRRRRKKKGLNDSTLQQALGELNSDSLSDVQKESTVVPEKDDSSETKHENSSLEERKLWSSVENSATLHSSLNSPSENANSKTNVGVTSVESCSNTDQRWEKKQHTVPNLTASYSDKVKSLIASKNSSIASCNLSTEKSWMKDFSPESSKMKKEKHSQNSVLQAGERTLASNISHGTCKTKEIKGGKRTGEDRRYSRLKNDEPLKSHARNVEQISREGKQTGRNNILKKLTCDDDDDDDDNENWRLKRDDPKVADPTVLSRTENITKSNAKNLDTESVNKRTYQGKEDAESKKFDKHAKCDILSSHITVDEGRKSLKKQQKLSEFVSALPVNEACNTMSSSSINAGNDLQNGTRRISDSANSLSVAPSNNKIMEGEFPDLRDSVKIKKRSAVDSRTSDHKEMTSSSKPLAPLSYSAVLQSTPQPKPVAASAAWESEHTTKQGGLLKVPPQTTADGTENEAEADGNKQKKKKKKKKKKTKEAGENSQENASTKRTEKPIQFDLGVMLQTISTSSTGKKQSSKKHVVATGVLPSQLSAASTSEVKSSVKIVQLLKKDEKVPHNVLDSTAPVVKRGKERETPAKKKPSALKKIILKEREEKKKAREGETVETDKDDEIFQDEHNRTCEPGEENTAHHEVQSSSEDGTVYSEPSSPTDQEIAAEMHSRKFREYCFQVPDKEVDTVAMDLLRELVRFQDRQFHKDPVKAKAKRRFVLGLREVSKHLKLRKLKCVIISSNVERIKSAGGLDDTLSSIITSCQENQIPVVFALKRQLLGKVLLKKVPVSIVGIFNYDGAQDHFKTLIELTQKTRQAYTEKWTEIRERLELQQKENKSIASTTETDKELSAGAEMSNLPQPIMEEDAVSENQQAEATESTDDDNDDDDDDDGIDDDENSDNRHNETDDVIIENDLEIQEF